MCDIKNKEIPNDKFQKAYEIIRDLFNIVVVLKYFCETQCENEALGNVEPLVKTLFKQSDLLYSFFINVDNGELE